MHELHEGLNEVMAFTANGEILAILRLMVNFFLIRRLKKNFFCWPFLRLTVEIRQFSHLTTIFFGPIETLQYVVQFIDVHWY